MKREKKPRVTLEPPDPPSGGKRIRSKQPHPARAKLPKLDEEVSSEADDAAPGGASLPGILSASPSPVLPVADAVGVAPDAAALRETDAALAENGLSAAAPLPPEQGRPAAAANKENESSSDDSSESSDSDAEEPGPPEQKEEEMKSDDSEARRSQFGGIWAPTATPGRKQPADMPTEEFGTLFMSLAAAAFKSGQKPGHPPNRIQRMAVVEGRTGDAAEVCHRFALLADKQFVPAPLKRLFREKHGIALEFTAVHETYWGTFVEMVVPADGAPRSALDPKPWLSPGHPSVSDILQRVPPSAYASEKARVRAFLGLGGERRPPPAAIAC